MRGRPALLHCCRKLMDTLRPAASQLAASCIVFLLLAQLECTSAQGKRWGHVNHRSTAVAGWSPSYSDYTCPASSNGTALFPLHCLHTRQLYTAAAALQAEQTSRL